ncbi:MAG TPA: hypothetical protein VFZ03_00780, partial [Dongiaceae bacterium]
VATKKTTCGRVRRRVAGKTRDEIIDAIYAEFDLSRPKTREEQPGSTAKSKPAKPPRKAKP